MGGGLFFVFYLIWVGTGSGSDGPFIYLRATDTQRKCSEVSSHKEVKEW